MNEGTNPTYRRIILEVIEIMKTRDYHVAIDLLSRHTHDAWSEVELADIELWITRLHEMNHDTDSSYTSAIAAIERLPKNVRLRLRLAELEWKRSRDRPLAEEHVRVALALLAQRSEFRSAKILLTRIALSSGDFRAAAQHMLESVPESNREAQLGPALLLQEAVQLAQSGETDGIEYLKRLRSLHAEDPEATREIEDALMRAMGTSS
jgi:hypothetical protein